MSLFNDILSGVEKLLIGSVHATASGAGGKTPSGDIMPGDINLQTITLLSEDRQRQYDMLPQVQHIDFYESILSPVLFCDLTVSDSIGLLQSFPIIGEEYVSIVMQTPGARGAPATLLFRVNQVKDKVVNENLKSCTYTIQLVSAEVVRNASRMITLPYENTIDNVIQSIVRDELGTQKPVHVDHTIGIEKGTITRMEPFKAIDFLRRKAVSAQYKSSSWVFYESRDGYFFTTIERLMDEGAKAIATGHSDKEFFFDASRKESVSSVTIRNILAYNQISFADTVSKIQSGGISNEVAEFDIMTGSVRKVKSDPQQQFKTADGSASAPLNTSGFIGNHSKTTAATRFVTVSSDRPDTQLAERISQSATFTQAITQNIVQVHVYGDTEIKLGDVIKCSFPSASGSDDDKGVSRLDSGNYLVAKIRHMIINGDRPSHSMALELIKGNLTESA